MFKPGDKVVLLPTWNRGVGYDAHKDTVFTIIEIVEEYIYNFGNVFRIVLTTGGLWAEPQEIRLYSPLEEAMK